MLFRIEKDVVISVLVSFAFAMILRSSYPVTHLMSSGKFNKTQKSYYVALVKYGALPHDPASLVRAYV